MKSTRAQAAINKKRLLEVGSQRFRELGYNGIGVVDLMREVGQTHGAFYGNFASKDEFVAQACTRGYDETLETWPEAAEAIGKVDDAATLEGFVRTYLSTSHRDSPGHGCVTAALGADAGRQGAIVRAATADGIQRTLALLSSAAPGNTEAERRRHAIGVYASLIGAMTMARAVGDSQLSAEILQTVTDRLLTEAAR